MHNINIGLLSSLYLIIVIHQYIEIPYFMVIYILIVVLLLIVSWKEITDFFKAIDAIQYDFRIQKTDTTTTRQNLLSFLILIFVLPYFISFPYEFRDDLEDIFIFQVIFFFLFYFILFVQPSYDYYLFGNHFITGPGLKLESFRWSEIKAVETHEKKETFYLHLKEGSKIKFDLKRYYSDQKWDEVMSYFNEREVKVVKI